jgi:hypothetical protein
MDGMRGLDKDVAIASLRLHMHVIEMADAIDELLQAGCGQAAFGPARGAFEASLSLAAIHNHPDFREASLAWLVGSLRREIQRRQDLRKLVVTGGRATQMAQLGSLDAEIAKLEGVIRQPHLAAVAERVRKGNWLAVLGVKNQFSLSQTLDEAARDRARVAGREPDAYSRTNAYIVLYGPWSSGLHGSDWSRIARPGNGEGKVGIPEIRNQTVLPQIVPLIASLVLEATRLQVCRFRPDQESALVRWYVERVREPYLRLTSLKVNVE